MTVNMGDRKLRLIQEIMNLKDERALAKLEHEVEAINKEAPFWEAVKPIRQSITLEQMIAEQGYTPIEKEAFYEKVSKIDIEEPLEYLLAQLSR